MIKAKQHLRRGRGINKYSRACHTNTSANGRYAALSPQDFFDTWKYNKTECCEHCVKIFKEKVAKATGKK